MFPELDNAEVSSALDAVIDDLLQASDLAAPPVNSVLVAQRLGLQVAFDDQQLGRARIVRGNSRYGGEQTAILIRQDPRPERLQWAVAHEIGESVAYQVFERLGVDPALASPNAREETANALANRLLLPGGWFFPEAIRTHYHLFILKQRFATASHELIARRLLEGTEPGIVSVFDQGRLTWRRGNRNVDLPLSDLERSCWQAARIAGSTRRCAAQGIHVQAWPVHEPDWQREIVHTIWDEM